jgi:hypothetical protein
MDIKNNTFINFLIEKRIQGEAGNFCHIAAFVPKLVKNNPCLKCG